MLNYSLPPTTGQTPYHAYIGHYIRKCHPPPAWTENGDGPPGLNQAMLIGLILIKARARARVSID